MPGAFWDSWQLWQKMCFVLGAAIVVVVILALGKLTHDRWKLRKFTKVATAQGDDAPQMQQTKRRGRSGNDIPFGVRALESGVEVEGVWISRPTSPNNSSRNSPNTSPKNPASPELGHLNKGKSVDKNSNIPAIVMPKAAYSSRAYSNDASRNSVSVSSEYDRAVDAERLSSTRSTSRTVSPNGSHRTHKPSYKPRQSSHLRYTSFHEDGSEELESSNGSHPNRSPSGSSSDSRESLPTTQPGPSYYRPKRQSKQPSYHSYGNNQVPFVEPRRSEIDLMPFQSQSGVDLSYLSPRRSLAAEAGLLPKSRASSTDGGSARSTPRPAILEEDEEPKDSTANVRPNNDPFATPSQTPEPAQGLPESDAAPFSSLLASDPKFSQNWPLTDGRHPSESKESETKKTQKHSQFKESV